MEKTLKISEQQAIELYPTARPDLKKLLEINFGKRTFCKSFQELVKSYEDACEIAGENPVDECKMRDLGFLDCEIALRKIKTIIKASNILNDNWEADFSDQNQAKWYPWFVYRSCVFRFSRTPYSNANSDIGSRLCCKSEAIAKIIGERFESIWDIYLKGK